MKLKSSRRGACQRLVGWAGEQRDRVPKALIVAKENPKLMRLILMGTGPFAVPSFQAIANSGDHEIALVVTKPEPPVKSRKGPPPAPVREWATSTQLPLFDPQSINDEAAVRRITHESAELLVVCDYGQILKPPALSAARLGGVNLHGSLLPAYRGAAPVQRSLLSGDRETGVTVIHMTPRLDGGPILGTVQTEILDTETAGELEERLSLLGVPLTLRCIEQLSKWDETAPIGKPQDAANATKAPRLGKSEARIDWTRTTREIDCHVRGMQPWPIAFSEIQVRENKPPLRVAVLGVEQVELPVSSEPADLVNNLQPDLSGLAPGQIAGGKEMIVVTGDGALKLTKVRPAGKRDMSGDEFLRGHQLPRGTRLT